jgi:nicotinate-nucleotide--dimethylbenzimidazole phosphoribosyltransferase
MCRMKGRLGKCCAALARAPLLDLGLRLGEGSGAALAAGLIKAALACHADMATFEQAQVARKGAT